MVLFLECLLERLLTVAKLRVNIAIFLFLLHVHLLECLGLFPLLLDFRLEGPHLGLSLLDSLVSLLEVPLLLLQLLLTSLQVPLV